MAFLLAALTFAALLPVLLPLLRGLGKPRDGASFDRAVYRDQLREVERDIERGLLTGAEAGAARLEIQRRLLAARSETTPDKVGKAPVLALLVGLAAATGSVGVYLFLGFPVPPSASGPEADPAARWAAHVRQNPDDAAGWAQYARAVSRLERWADAETAWRRVIALGSPSVEAVASLGEIVVMREGGSVGLEAKGFFELALRGEPGNAMARYYLALEKAQTGDAKAALAQWVALLEDLPPDAPGRRDIAMRMEQTARAAGLPVPADTGRLAMIESMVAKLAERLAKEPGDADGWAKLGRSYMVLGQGEAAANAYERAAALTPGEPALKRAAAEALLAGLKPEDPMPARALALLREVEPALPQDPAVLWYLGLAEARDRKFDKARDYWNRLTKALPPDGDDIKMVRAALEALGRPK